MIALPKSLTTIGDEAFAGCRALTGDLIAPSCLTEIGRGAFAGCYGIDNARMVEAITEPTEDTETAAQS